MEEGNKRIIVIMFKSRGKMQANVNNVIHACMQLQQYLYTAHTSFTVVRS